MTINRLIRTIDYVICIQIGIHNAIFLTASSSAYRDLQIAMEIDCSVLLAITLILSLRNRSPYGSPSETLSR
jgi:hypothetical protein